MNARLEEALFAGGCFWSFRRYLEALPGVLEATAGYAGGQLENPDYARVCSGTTGHREVVRVRFNPEKIGYRELLDCFWDWIDPTNAIGQGPDIGTQYRSAVYYYSAEQQRLAEESLQRLRLSGRYARPLVTPILPAPPFWQAEEEHQHR